jgi:hypothetical protein
MQIIYPLAAFSSKKQAEKENNKRQKANCITEDQAHVATCQSSACNNTSSFLLHIPR